MKWPPLVQWTQRERRTPHPRPAKRGEGGERPQARPSSMRYGREPGEGRSEHSPRATSRWIPRPSLRSGHPLPASRGEGAAWRCYRTG